MSATALVLGAGVWPGGTPSPTLRRRALHAAALFHAGEIDGAVLCGGLGRHPPSEARVMADLLRAQGVPGSALVLEETSTDTIGNIANALALCPGLRDVVIVTDAFHAPRACLVAWRLGLRARASCPGQGPRRAAWLRATAREGAALVKVGIWAATGHKWP